METRDIIPADLPLLSEWIQRDRFNRGTMKPEIFQVDKGGNAVTALFSVGSVPFAFARLRACMRLDVQFSPDRRLVATSLPEAVAWIAQAARNAQMTQVVFESRSPRLTSFLCDSLGFSPSPDEYVLNVFGKKE